MKLCQRVCNEIVQSIRKCHFYTGKMLVSLSPMQPFNVIKLVTTVSLATLTNIILLVNLAHTIRNKHRYKKVYCLTTAKAATSAAVVTTTKIQQTPISSLFYRQVRKTDIFPVCCRTSTIQTTNQRRNEATKFCNEQRNTNFKEMVMVACSMLIPTWHEQKKKTQAT